MGLFHSKGMGTPDPVHHKFAYNVTVHSLRLQSSLIVFHVCPPFHMRFRALRQPGQGPAAGNSPSSIREDLSRAEARSPK